MSARRRRLLIGVVLILPCLAITVLGVQLVVQGNRWVAANLQLEENRQFDRVGRDLAAWLERLKLDQATALTAAAGAVVPSPAHPEIAVVGWIAEGRLVLPWEVAPPPAAEPSRAYRDAIRHGRHAEVVTRDLPTAIARYDRARREARTPAEIDDAELMRAGALVKAACECTTEARTIYERLLTSHTVDEHGVPLAMYAAGELIKARESERAVLDMLEDRLMPDAWLGPVPRYRQRDLLDMLAKRATAAAERERARSLRTRLERALVVLEQRLALQREFSQLLPGTDTGAATSAEPVWVPFSKSSLWLVSAAPALAGLPRFAMAVSADETFQAVARELASADLAPVFSFDLDGGRLVGVVPGLRVRLAPLDGSPLRENWRRQLTFFGVALACVLGFTLAGGYLFWRDVRRELRVAEMRSQFVASVSHELKTPLTAIRMFAETLQLDRAADADARRQYLDTIVKESERLTRLIDNVLAFSTIERGEKVYRLEPAALASVVRDAVDTMHYPLARMGFDLRADLGEDLPDVPIDADGIRQAVLNLLSNAIKYSTDRRQVAVSLRRVNGDAVIAVTDYGIGIPAAEQRRIFDRFYRARVVENERIPGTGLGLALVHHIVRAHQGRIEVQSEPGHGSTFAIHLPLQNDAAASAVSV